MSQLEMRLSFNAIELLWSDLPDRAENLASHGNNGKGNGDIVAQITNKCFRIEKDSDEIKSNRLRSPENWAVSPMPDLTFHCSCLSVSKFRGELFIDADQYVFCLQIRNIRLPNFSARWIFTLG
jgi:hypothetical protein